MEKLRIKKSVVARWHKRISFMLLVATLLSMLMEPLNAWAVEPTGSTEQAKDGYFTDEEGNTHKLTSTYSDAVIKYNTDTYYTVPDVYDRDGNRVVVSMREIADCEKVDKDFNGADTNCGFKYNSKDNDEYVTGNDMMHAMQDKYSDQPEVFAAIVSAISNGSVPYSYNTINAYNASEISADGASGYADYNGKTVLSQTYSLDGWYAPKALLNTRLHIRRWLIFMA